MTDGEQSTEPDAEPTTPARPLLRVVRGAPTPVELAALVAVMAARCGGAAPADDAPAPSPSPWSRPVMTPVPVVGPGAWASSAQAGVRTRAGW